MISFIHYIRHLLDVIHQDFIHIKTDIVIYSIVDKIGQQNPRIDINEHINCVMQKTKYKYSINDVRRMVYLYNH